MLRAAYISSQIIDIKNAAKYAHLNSFAEWYYPHSMIICDSHLSTQKDMKTFDNSWVNRLQHMFIIYSCINPVIFRLYISWDLLSLRFCALLAPIILSKIEKRNWIGFCQAEWWLALAPGRFHFTSPQCKLAFCSNMLFNGRHQIEALN